MVVKESFRYDINALRAIAVTGVLLFHFNVPHFPGGFCGVDVFFVISGYLMSKIIIEGINKKNFSFLNFYEKRLKRIVPALLVMVLVLTALGFFLYFPIDYQSNEKNAAASLLFVSNILYWRTSDYFDAASRTNVLLHTWSLSVEWQFYIIYPIILVVFHKLSKNSGRYLLLFLAAAALLFAFSMYLTKMNAEASFYLLPGRAWEMMLGGVAFSSGNFVRSESNRKVIAITGYMMILLSFIFLRNYYSWPNKYTLIPVSGTFMVIAANWNNFGILKNRFIQYTGKTSYSIYLWHWPALVFFQYFGFGSTPVSVLLLFVLSFVLGFLSFKYVEQPASNRRSKAILAASGLLFICTASLSSFNSNSMIFKPGALRFSAFKSHYTAERITQFSEGSCFMDLSHDVPGANKFDKNQCLVTRASKKNLLLIGDSHAAQISTSLKRALDKMGINMLQATVTGCLPLIQPNGDDGYNLIDYIYRDFIVKHAGKIDGVILCANWRLGSDNLKNLAEELRETVNYNQKNKIKTIIIGQNETYTIPYPTIVAQEVQYNSKIANRFLETASYNTNEYLAENLKKVYVDVFNSGSPPPVSPDNIPYMFDDNHLTTYGADMEVKKILANDTAADFFKSILVKRK